MKTTGGERHICSKLTAGLVPAAAVTIIIALIFLALGCGQERQATTEAGQQGGYGVASTAAETTVTYQADKSGAAPTQDSAAYSGTRGLGSLRPGEQKVISNATVQIEVETGHFQAVFAQVKLLADKYGGYVVNASSSATGEEKVIRSGVISLRVPSSSLNAAIADVSKLGKVTSEQIESQDVTEEYVDLEARLRNAQAQEQSLLSLLQQAKTIEENLRVRDVLSQVQAEIEQIKGRLAFLEEHTSYATLTVSLYESGVVIAPGEGWGFLKALRDAAKAFVRTVNELVVFFGGALPVLVLLAIVAWIVYAVVKAVLRRREQGRSGRRPEGPTDTPLQQ